MIRSSSHRFIGTRGTIVTGAALVLFAICLRFVTAAYSVPTTSMEPTLLPGDHLLVIRKIAGSPARGDVVVFDSSSGTSLVKRIIGMAGDSVQIERGHVLVNGEPLAEDAYVTPSSSEVASVHIVPQGHVFLLGDNRDHSADSREFGFVSTSKIVGRARIIYWSVAPKPDGGHVRWSRVLRSID